MPRILTPFETQLSLVRAFGTVANWNSPVRWVGQ
jgi:hypothetical protein